MAKASTIREKIAHLLALAESPEPEEAKAALLRARELMAKHKFRPEECVDTKSTKVVRETLDVTRTTLTNPWACSLAAEIAKRIFLYAYDCAISAIKHDVKKDPLDPPGTYREQCNAYGWGFVDGVDAAFREQEENHKDWGLALVVPQAVTDSMKDMGKKSPFGQNKGTSEKGR